MTRLSTPIRGPVAAGHFAAVAKLIPAVTLGAVAGLAVLAAGCQAPARQSGSRAAGDSRAPQAKSDTGSEAADTPPIRAGSGTILMMGRSVMYGWFQHWNNGAGAEIPVRKGRHTLKYVEISTPPDIARSVEEKLAETSGRPAAVFFKFCFDDFGGSSREEASASLAEKKRFVREVYKSVVVERRLPLILSTALPKVTLATDDELVWNHRQFNSWLKGFAADHADRVFVFDMYAVMAAPDGSLLADYATGPEDSHPNERAYAQLDKAFMPLLSER